MDGEEPKRTDELGRFTPGNGGRPKGTPNKATQRAREAITLLLDQNSDRLQGWLEEIYEAEGAKVAWQCFTDLVEFGVPKLSRSDVHATVDGAVHIHATPTEQKL